jgi:tRNA U34 2-thiouridine synthase MnmA/TrmU
MWNLIPIYTTYIVSIVLRDRNISRFDNKITNNVFAQNRKCRKELIDIIDSYYSKCYLSAARRLELLQKECETNKELAAILTFKGICFLGKIHYNDFIKRYLGEREGKIVEFETGKILGTHKGYWFHTIGQRKGLGLGEGPWFVIKKDIEENVLYVSRGYDTQSQYGNVVNLSAFQYISKDIWGNFDSIDVKFKIRHTPQFTQGKMTRIGDVFRIESEDKIQGIASGQFGVVYDNDAKLCVGSGVII